MLDSVQRIATCGMPPTASAGVTVPDAPEFEEFYQANYGRLVALVAAMTGDRGEAEDVAQEAFSRALSRWNRLGGYDLPEAWLRKVALRIAVDSSRRVRRTVLVAARVAAQRPRPAPLPEDGLGFTGLGRALRRLPASHRQVLVLHYIADLPVDQIARECGIPPGTVKARLAAGRRRLERELSDDPEVVRDAR
jgi:RNA polymerase sigma-70 factor (ECF subfamily)